MAEYYMDGMIEVSYRAEKDRLETGFTDEGEEILAGLKSVKEVAELMKKYSGEYTVKAEGAESNGINSTCKMSVLLGYIYFIDACVDKMKELLNQ